MIAKIKSLNKYQGFMKYFKNTSWLFFEKIVRMATGLFVGIWVTRYLGPEKFGLFSYAQSFVGLFTVFATLGLDSIVIRELVKDERNKDILLGTVFWLKVLGAFITLGFLAVAVNFTTNNHFTNIIIFIIASSTVFQSFNVIDMYFQSRVMSRYIVYVNIISLFIASIINIFLILNKASLIYFVLVVLFNSFVLALGYIYVYLHNNLSIKSWTFKIDVAKGLLKDSWPLILSGIAIALYMRIDQVMIKEMMGAKAVGQYAAAVKLSEAWYFIPMAIASSLFPAIINAKKQSEELYYIRLQKLYDLMVWMAIVIAIPMTFLSSWIIHLLYGEQYNQASSVLMVHIWTGIFVFLGVASSKYLISESLTKIYFHRTLLGAVVNIFLNYILIPIYGINGAALATLIGQLTANYIFDIFNIKLHGQLKMKTMSFFPIHILKGYK